MSDTIGTDRESQIRAALPPELWGLWRVERGELYRADVAAPYAVFETEADATRWRDRMLFYADQVLVVKLKGGAE